MRLDDVDRHPAKMRVLSESDRPRRGITRTDGLMEDPIELLRTFRLVLVCLGRAKCRGTELGQASKEETFW
jgi:hypothetical protein